MTSPEMPAAASCSEPEVFEALTAYAFGDELNSVTRERVDRHLRICPTCAAELRRLSSAIRVLRHDPHLTPLLPAPDVVSVLGLSGRLEMAFGGHIRFATAAAALFAWLHAVPVVVEVAYEFDRYGSIAVGGGVGAFLWMLGVTLTGLWVTTKDIQVGGAGVTKGLTVWLAGTALLCAVLWQIFPAEPTVLASFGTWPSNLGYLKSVFYAWLVGPVFLLWPFQFVLSMQRELARGRHQGIVRLLSGDKGAIPPRGTLQPPLWALAVLWSGLFVFNYIGVNHLFSALQPDPHANLFRALVLLRSGAWMVLPAVCLIWYAHLRTELRRQAAFSAQLLGLRE